MQKEGKLQPLQQQSCLPIAPSDERYSTPLLDDVIIQLLRPDKILKYTPFKLGGSVILLGMPPRFQFKLRSCVWSEALVTSALRRRHTEKQVIAEKDVTGRQFLNWKC